MPDGFDRLADFLGRDHRSIAGILWAAQHNSKMRGAAYYALRRRCKQETGVNPDNLPPFPLVRELPAGELVVGNALNGQMLGPVFALPISDTKGHFGVFGATGQGKSFLAKHLITEFIRAGGRAWVFDTEGEHGDILSLLPAEVLVPVTPDALRISLFEPPRDSIEPKVWLGEIGLQLRGSTFIRDGAENLFGSSMLKLFERKGILTGSRAYPTLDEAFAHFAGMSFGPKSRNATWLESLTNRLTMLSNALGPTFSASTSGVLPFLANRSAIFRLNGLQGGVAVQFFAGFLLAWLAAYKEGETEPAMHMVVIEEAHVLLPDRNRMDLGEAVLPDLFRRGRKRSMILAILDQVPGLLPPAVLANLGCCITMRITDPKSLWTMGNSMALTPEQSAVLPELQAREAVVRIAAHPKPFLARIRDLSFGPRPSEAEMRRRAEDALAGVTWTPGIMPPSARHGSPTVADGPAQLGELPGDALKVMLDICARSDHFIDERCEETQLDRSRELRARKMLLDRGLIEELSQTMGKLTFYQVTPKGEDWAHQHRVHVKKYKSGPVHEAILTKVQRALGMALPGARFQRGSTIGSEIGKEPDLALTLKEGRAILVEVCCHNVTRQVETLLEEAAIQDVDMLVAVTAGVELRRKLQQELDKKAKDSGPRLFTKGTVTVISAPDCLEPGFDWVDLLSRP